MIGCSRLFAVLLWMLVPVTAARAQDSLAKDVQVKASVEGGFARIIFDWPDEVKGSASVVDGVLVITFDRPFDFDLGPLAKTLEPYSALIRRDGDGRGLRMALKGPIRLKATDLAYRHAFDLLPPTFRGDPPAVSLPEIATPKRQLLVRATEREKSTRLQFDFPGEVSHAFRVNGDKLIVTFSKPAKVDLTRFTENPPSWIRGARSVLERNKLTLEFDIDREADFRDVSQGGEIALVLQEPKSDASVVIEKPDAVGAPRVLLADADAQAPPPPKVVADEIVFELPLRKGAAAAKEKMTVKEPAVAPGAGVRLDDNGALEARLAPGEATVTDQPALGGAIPVADPLPKALRLGQADLTAALAPNVTETPPVPGVARAQVFGSILRVELPYAKLPAASVFRRGFAVWVVADSPTLMDLKAIGDVPNSPVSVLSEASEVAPGITAFRLAAPASLSVSLSAAGDSWVLAIGNAVPELPERLQVIRQTAGDTTRLRVPMPGLTQVLWLKDPDLQDRIAVVMGHAPARGLVEGRRFVDFAALPSRHGVAIQAIADDLNVTIEGNEAVISRPAGLNVSSAQFVDALKLPASATSAQPSAAAADYLAFKREKDTDIYRSLGKLLLASAKSADGLSAPRMELARHYVANGFGAEALGVLRTITHADKTADGETSFRVLRALANIQMARYPEALDDLNIESLASDPHLAFWKGLASAGVRDWRAARNNLVAAMKIMPEYPPDWHARGRTALAVAALGLGDAAAAQAALETVPASGLSPAVQADVMLVQALTDLELDRKDKALAQLDALARSRYRPVAARASLDGTLAKLALGKMEVPEAIEALERLRYRWRGDELELRTLRELSQLYVRENKLREAMGTMRLAVRNFGESEQARESASQMSSMFESFFIGEQEKRLSPLDALSLFYDYKELTPVGVRGDEMIRRLVERLVSVDLLPQAAELLQHQVDNRLEGVAKSAVAVRLAVIQLLDKQPSKALETIRKTRQTRLPDDLIFQRDIVEARALADTKDYERALDVLEAHTGEEAEALRADVLWDAQRWPEAGAKVEAILGARYADDKPLDELERLSLMRACIAFSLAGDVTSLERLRSRFEQKMRTSPDANAFAMLTSAPDVTSVDYKTLVKRIASVEMLEAFFSEFRAKSIGASAMVTN